MSHLDPRPDSVGEDIPNPLAGDDSSPGRSRISESAKGVRPAPPPTSKVLRTLETRCDLLRARGLAIPPLDLARAYARHLVARTLSLSAASEGETGFDARDSWGVRYRIVGHRNGVNPAHVRVPGIPDRCFDRIVLVEFGAGFGVTRAVIAPDEPFLRNAEYHESGRIWILPLAMTSGRIPKSRA